MHDIARSYEFGDTRKIPTIDGQEFPWCVSLNPGPMVEATEIGHILWVPIIVEAPMPSPPEGRPNGTPLSGHAEALPNA